MFPSGNVPTPETMEKKRNALAEERSVKHDEYLSLKAKVSELEKAHKTVDDFLRQEKIAVKKEKRKSNCFRRTEIPLFAFVICLKFCILGAKEKP